MARRTLSLSCRHRALIDHVIGALDLEQDAAKAGFTEAEKPAPDRPRAALNWIKRLFGDRH